ncbi:hypothetical protein MRB53_000361 [Persea americana]|uniref:Uncharacterized protein n=1 Tax=Persea americana TaxID=3435 RepID=A0ACC2MPL2_PERAE|nr:hypothetical protein MRB53_000361 [Persea americana]
MSQQEEVGTQSSASMCRQESISWIMVSRRLGDPDFHLTWLSLQMVCEDIASSWSQDILMSSWEFHHHNLGAQYLSTSHIQHNFDHERAAWCQHLLGFLQRGGSMQAHAGDEAPSYNRRVGNLGSQPTWRVLLEESRNLEGLLENPAHGQLNG